MESNLKNIVIIGASGLGKEIYTIVSAINKISKKWEVLGFYDDAFLSQPYEVIDGVQCLGKISDLLEQTNQNIDVVFGMADRTVVQSIFNKLKQNSNFNFPNVIHPTVIIETESVLGMGNVMARGCVISCSVTIGNFNFLNGMTVFGHDASVNNFNCFMPRVQISGSVTLGDHNFFGMNASIIQDKKIGNHNTILAYSLLTKNIGDNRKYFGIPAKRVDI